MPLVSIAFQFSQRFPFSAREVYDWATDYTPHDMEAMGMHGRRRIVRVCNDTILVNDTFPGKNGKSVRKRKLVRLYPERLAWTNTHVAGPNKYSQFLYEVTPLGKRGCRLDFAGRQVSNLPTATKKDIAALARTLKRDDAAIWKNLARAMKAEREASAAR